MYATHRNGCSGPDWRINLPRTLPATVAISRHPRSNEDRLSLYKTFPKHFPASRYFHLRGFPKLLLFVSLGCAYISILIWSRSLFWSEELWFSRAVLEHPAGVLADKTNLEGVLQDSTSFLQPILRMLRTLDQAGPTLKWPPRNRQWSLGSLPPVVWSHRPNLLMQHGCSTPECFSSRGVFRLLLNPCNLLGAWNFLTKGATNLLAFIWTPSCV